MPPIPWFGPTLYELVPDTPLGARPPLLRKQAAQAQSAVQRDPVQSERIRRADRNSHSIVDAVVAEMLTPPLPSRAPEECT
ncbi:hypothetical protein [Embleya sp. NPDC050493]|uniref:hypothetical protein n=1 Tax=Embleya sp. NPDC050493 TaxID=3363989 RepID=UPI00379FEFCB